MGNTTYNPTVSSVPSEEKPPVQEGTFLSKETLKSNLQLAADIFPLIKDSSRPSSELLSEAFSHLIVSKMTLHPTPEEVPAIFNLLSRFLPESFDSKAQMIANTLDSAIELKILTGPQLDAVLANPIELVSGIVKKVAEAMNKKSSI